jgi:hypothetical protein
MTSFLTKPLFGGSTTTRRKKRKAKKPTNTVSKATLQRAKAKAFKAGRSAGFRNGKQAGVLQALTRRTYGR